MDVHVIEPGHGSFWLEDAVFVERMGNPNPRGRFVRGTVWSYENGPLDPDGGINIPETLTYPRHYVLRIEEARK